MNQIKNYTKNIFIYFVFMFGNSALLFAKELPPFKLGLNFQVVSTGFELMPKQTKTPKLKYRPAQSNYIGVIAGYRWLSGTVSFAIPASREIRDREGESWYQDYRLSYYWRKFGFELSYNRFRGYVIENRNLTRYNDISSKGYGFNAFYIFKTKPFSFPAALDQTDVQEKSGGSWLLQASYRYQRVGDYGAIIPLVDQASFGSDATLERYRTNSASVGGGYAYNANFLGSFFAAGVASLTLGYQINDYDIDVSSDSVSSLAGNLHARAALGYNSLRTFVTLSGYVDRLSSYTQSIEIGNLIFGAVFAVGARF